MQQVNKSNAAVVMNNVGVESFSRHNGGGKGRQQYEEDGNVEEDEDGMMEGEGEDEE
jgi:hypothetical protein